MMIDPTTLKDSAQIVTIDLVESRNLGVALTKNFMLLACAKTAT